MNRKALAVLHAAALLMTMTFLPLYSPKLLPTEMKVALVQGGFDLNTMLTEIAVIGAVLSCMALMGGFAAPTSIPHLSASIVSMIAWFAFTVVTFSLGNIESFGRITIAGGGGGSTFSVLFDLRLFVYLSFVTMVLRIVYSVLKFRDVRAGMMKAPTP